MGVLHHSTYFTYFEIGRTELLRAAGGNYRQMEADGQLVVQAGMFLRAVKPKLTRPLPLRATIRPRPLWGCLTSIPCENSSGSTGEESPPLAISAAVTRGERTRVFVARSRGDQQFLRSPRS